MSKVNDFIKWMFKEKYPNATYTFSENKFVGFFVGFEFLVIGLWMFIEAIGPLLGLSFIHELWPSIFAIIGGLVVMTISARKVYNRNASK